MDVAGTEQDRGTTTPGTENLSQPSATEKLTSGIEEGKQYAGADVKKLVEDALSADGREQKGRAEAAEKQVGVLKTELGVVTNQVTGLTAQISEIVKVQDDAEANQIKEDPAALNSLRARQANRTEATRLEGVKATIEARETKVEERLTAVGQKEISINIKLAAMAAGVDEKALADFVPDGDPERLSRATVILKQSTGPELDPLTGKPKVPVDKPSGLGIKPASMQSVGGESRGVAEVMLEKAKAK